MSTSSFEGILFKFVVVVVFLLDFWQLKCSRLRLNRAHTSIKEMPTNHTSSVLFIICYTLLTNRGVFLSLECCVCCCCICCVCIEVYCLLYYMQRTPPINYHWNGKNKAQSKPNVGCDSVKHSAQHACSILHVSDAIKFREVWAPIELTRKSFWYQSILNEIDLYGVFFLLLFSFFISIWIEMTCNACLNCTKPIWKTARFTWFLYIL